MIHWRSVSCALTVALIGLSSVAVRTQYPARPPVAPEILARGKVLYGVHCAFCHGTDARGGDGGGPNLLRSQLVLSDVKGERIGEVVLNGRPAAGMPPIALSAAEISDIADFLHSFPVGGDDEARRLPPTIVVGNAARGATAFGARCAGCHSASGDLKGLGARFADARQLQDYWLVPTTARGRGAEPPSTLRPVTAIVTEPSGQKIEGRLVRIDDFTVTIVPPDGTPRSFGRRGDVPKVEVVDPVKPHRDLLPKYTDDEIHDLTAYLVTLR
jgi:mono/diheme cytochrome c family protein